MLLALVVMPGISGTTGATTHAAAAPAPATSARDEVADESAADTTAARAQMTPWKATVLGVVEGVTEYLPVSSTGHLYITQQLLGVGDTEATKAPADSFAIVIQAGAILAVLILYRRRIVSVAEGLIGRSKDGRTILIALAVAFLPAAVIGIAAEGAIKSKLFAAWPIVIAWAVGGIAILALSDRLQHREAEPATDPPTAGPSTSDSAGTDSAGTDSAGTDSAGTASAGTRSPADGSTQPQRTATANRIGAALEAITPKQALIIGFAQVVAMWPGTSRSLVTIVAAVLVGMSVSAAVEFSFLLGLLTLGAATAYETLNNGSLLVEAYGGAEIALGLLVAFVTAAAAITWMVRWLERRSLAIFGWYRLAAAGVGAALLLTGTIS